MTELTQTITDRLISLCTIKPEIESVLILSNPLAFIISNVTRLYFDCIHFGVFLQKND